MPFYRSHLVINEYSKYVLRCKKTTGLNSPETHNYCQRGKTTSGGAVSRVRKGFPSTSLYPSDITNKLGVEKYGT